MTQPSNRPPESAASEAPAPDFTGPDFTGNEASGSDRRREVGNVLKTFYDTYGWTIDAAAGTHYHHSYFQDMHDSAVRYRYDHELRFKRYYDGGGRYFLDAGCGGEPRPKLAVDFQRHVCVDISIMGLKEARNQLGDSGDYVLADLTALPFKDQSFDGVLASHCLYHVEKDSQVNVLRDMYRTTKANKTILVFYSSRYNLVSLLHRIPILTLPLINGLLHRMGLLLTTNPPYVRRYKKGAKTFEDSVPALYSFAHNPMKLAREFSSVRVTCLMSLSNYDTQLLRRLRLLGIVLVGLDFLEKKFPKAMRYFGKYVCIRIVKSD